MPNDNIKTVEKQVSYCGLTCCMVRLAGLAEKIVLASILDLTSVTKLDFPSINEIINNHC